jgi:hypothetical protein
LRRCTTAFAKARIASTVIDILRQRLGDHAILSY